MIIRGATIWERPGKDPHLCPELRAAWTIEHNWRPRFCRDRMRALRGRGAYDRAATALRVELSRIAARGAALQAQRESGAGPSAFK